MGESGTKDHFSSFPPAEQLNKTIISRERIVEARIQKQKAEPEPEYDFSDYPELPPPPPYEPKFPRMPPPPPILSVDEAQINNGRDPSLYYLEKKYLEARLAEVEESGMPVIDAMDEEEEEYNRAKIRKESQALAPDAIKALQRILKGDPADPKDPKTVPTNAQILRAAEIVLDRSADKTATAPPDTSDKKQAYIILDRGVLPSNGK